MSLTETTSLTSDDMTHPLGHGSPQDGYAGVCSLEDEEPVANSHERTPWKEHSQTSVSYDEKRYVAKCYLCCYCRLYY